ELPPEILRLDRQRLPPRTQRRGAQRRVVGDVRLLPAREPVARVLAPALAHPRARAPADSRALEPVARRRLLEDLRVVDRERGSDRRLARLEVGLELYAAGLGAFFGLTSASS